MQKKILISSIIILITVILVAFGANFLYKYDQNKKLYTSINSHPITQEVTQKLAKTNEKVLNKVITNLTNLDLPPDEFIPYTDDSGEIKFLIPYNKKWGGNDNTLEVFENEDFVLSFGNGLVYYENGGETPVFRRNFEFSKTNTDAYEQKKNMPNNLECPKAEEVVVGENIFLKKQVCGLPGGTEYLLADFDFTYVFTNRGQDNDVFTKLLESVKHTDGTPFKVALLADLAKMTGNTTFTYQDDGVNLSFSYPKKWGKVKEIFDAQPFSGMLASCDTNFSEQEKSAIIESGKVFYLGDYYFSFIDNLSGGRGIRIEVIPYNTTKYFTLWGLNGGCWLDNLLESKKKIENNTNLSVYGYPAVLNDNFGDFMFSPSRSVRFFTPKHSVRLTLDYSVPQNYEDEEIKNMEQMFARSEHGEQLKSLLQEFMDMVKSFKIE